MGRNVRGDGVKPQRGKIRAVSLPCSGVPIISYSFTLQSDLVFFSLLEPKWSFCGVSMIHPLPHGKFQTDLVVRSGRRGVNVYALTESL